MTGGVDASTGGAGPPRDPRFRAPGRERWQFPDQSHQQPEDGVADAVEPEPQEGRRKRTIGIFLRLILGLAVGVLVRELISPETADGEKQFEFIILGVLAPLIARWDRWIAAGVWMVLVVGFIPVIAEVLLSMNPQVAITVVLTVVALLIVLTGVPDLKKQRRSVPPPSTDPPPR